jgi:uncharacterized membrane protein YidH (DUF202 family)
MKLFEILADGIIKPGDVPIKVVPANGDTMQVILTVVYATLGSISVLMIVFGGLRFMFSQGDSGKVAQARNTILYAVIGLVIAIAAFALAEFVIGKVN